MNNINIFNALQIITKAVKPENKITPVLVVNTDKRNGLYVKKLTKLVESLGLRDRDYEDDLTNMGELDGILFDANKNYDYRILSQAQLIAMCNDDNCYKGTVLELVNDFKKVEHEVEAMFTKKKPCKCSKNVDLAIVEISRNYKPAPAPKTFAPRSVLLTVESKPCEFVEKVTIFDNFVKIGFNLYDIYVDLFGNEFISHPYAGVLYVKKDRFGRKHLDTKA